MRKARTNPKPTSPHLLTPSPNIQPPHFSIAAKQCHRATENTPGILAGKIASKSSLRTFRNIPGAVADVWYAEGGCRTDQQPRGWTVCLRESTGIVRNCWDLLRKKRCRREFLVWFCLPWLRVPTKDRTERQLAMASSLSWMRRSRSLTTMRKRLIASKVRRLYYSKAPVY